MLLIKAKENRTSNVFLLFGLMIGNSMQVTLQAVEYYARNSGHCPAKFVWNKFDFYILNT